MKLVFFCCLLAFSISAFSQSNDGCTLTIKDLETLFNSPQPKKDVMLYQWKFQRQNNSINNTNDEVKRYTNSSCAIGIVGAKSYSDIVITYNIRESHYMNLLQSIEKFGYTYIGEKEGTDYLYKNGKYLITFGTQSTNGVKYFVIYVSNISDFRG